jgi:hypothetical protein
MKHIKHQDRKSFKKWGQGAQLRRSLLSTAQFARTCAYRGAFGIPLKRYLIRNLAEVMAKLPSVTPPTIPATV